MRLIDADKLIEWLLGKKYINVDENSTEMSEEFGKEHLWELSRNCFIAKIIKYINSQSFQLLLLLSTCSTTLSTS